MPWWLSATVASIVLFLGATAFALAYPKPLLEISELPKTLDEAGYSRDFFQSCVQTHLRDSASQIGSIQAAQHAVPAISPAHAPRATSNPTGSGKSVSGLPSSPDYRAEYYGRAGTNLIAEEIPEIEKATFLSLPITPRMFASSLRTGLRLNRVKDALIRVNIYRGSDSKGVFNGANVTIDRGTVSYTAVRVRGEEMNQLCEKISDYIGEELYPTRYAWGLLQAGDLHRAQTVLHAIIETDPREAPLASMYLGLVQTKRGNFDAAEQSLKPAIDSHLNSGWMNEGLLKFEQGDFKESIRISLSHVEEARQDSDKSIYYNNVGAAYLELHDDDSAIAWFKKGTEASPYPKAYMNLCAAYLRTGDLPSAQRICAAAHRLNPSDADTSLNLVKAHYADIGEQLTQRLEDLDSSHEDTFREWARWLAQTHGSEEALAFLSNSGAEFTTAGSFEYAQGQVHLAAGQYEHAERSFVAAGNLGYREADSYQFAAEASRQLDDDHSPALLAASALHEMDAAQRDLKLARMYGLINRSSEMQSFMVRAQRTGLDSAYFYDYWGRLLENGKQLAQAQDKYRQALDHNKYFAPAHLDLGAVLAQRSRLAAEKHDATEAGSLMLQAQSEYTQAVNLTPWDVTPAVKSEIARWWAAAARSDRQQVGESVTKNIEKILRGAGPGTDRADLAQDNSDLGDIYLEQGNNERALQAFDRCVKLSPLRPQCWIHAGRARERLLGEARVMSASSAGYRQVADDYIQAFLLDDENDDTRSGVRELVAHPEVFGLQWCSNPQLMKRLANVDARLGKIARRDCRADSMPMLAARNSRS